MNNEIEANNNSTRDQGQDWQRDLINRLAFASLNEQKKTRRWGIFFKSLLFAYLFLIFFVAFLPDEGGATKITVGKHTALIEINGVIADNTPANADMIITGLRNAFEDSKTAGVILRINSPGGSPVQAGYINDEIYRLRKQYPDTKVYAVVTDICASGGYYIAASADEIYADKASIVGSIGVLMNSFGFVGAIDKLGIERRLYTAGESKGFLDPFLPEKKEDVAHIKDMLNNIHQQFIEVVKKGRGERLKDDPRLFTGLIWTGEESVEMGLVDALGSSSHVARDVIKAEKIVDFTLRPGFFDRFADRLGMVMANTLAQTFGFQPGGVR